MLWPLVWSTNNTTCLGRIPCLSTHLNVSAGRRHLSRGHEFSVSDLTSRTGEGYNTAVYPAARRRATQDRTWGEKGRKLESKRVIFHVFGWDDFIYSPADVQQRLRGSSSHSADDSLGVFRLTLVSNSTSSSIVSMHPPHWHRGGANPEKYTVPSSHKVEPRSATAVQCNVIHHHTALAKYVPACIPGKSLFTWGAYLCCLLSSRSDRGENDWDGITFQSGKIMFIPM